MKVTFLTARYPPDVLGGGEISTAITAEGLAAAGVSVEILAGSPNDQTETIRGVHVVRARSLLSWWSKPLHEQTVSRRTAHVVQELLARLGSPDIIHAHEFRSALSLSLLAHPRRVVTIRDFAPICGTTNNLWWDGSSCDGCSWTNVLFRCHRVAEAHMARKPFRVWQYKGNLATRLKAYRQLPVHVYTSQCLKERVTARLGTPKHVHAMVIPNAVEPAWLVPTVPPPQAPRLCAVGRLETSKGTAILLEALSYVRRAVPTVHLQLVGGGEVVRHEKLARSLQLDASVTFHGTRPHAEVRAIMDASRLVVSPHLWEEPFGRVALEAGARSRPLVTSDLGGIRELTTPATATRVPPKDARALARAMVDLLEHPLRAEQMGRAAREHVQKNYAPERIAREHIALYERI